MRFREHRLRFERLEQRKVFSADVDSESLVPSLAQGDSASDVLELSEPMEADGVRAAEVRIQFDPLSVQPDLSTIKAGDAWNGKASVVANVDEIAGTLVAFLFTTRPITGQGNLLELEFKSAGSDPVGTTPASIGIEQVRLNEGQIEVTSDLTILAAPSQTLDQTDDSIGSDGAVNATRDGRDSEEHVFANDGIFANNFANDEVFASLQELAADKGIADRHTQLGDGVEGDLAVTHREHDDEIDSNARREAQDRLHDLQVTSVFIGPLRPDFLDE
jgi:hypothetical protein